MEITRRLMEMKQAIPLLTDELLVEGWAVSRDCGSSWRPGLALITNWRIICLDPDTGLSAIPISREVEIECSTPTTLIISAWHERMVLKFDGPSALASVKRLLKQAPGWASAGLNASRNTPGRITHEWRDLAVDGGVTVRATGGDPSELLMMFQTSL